MEWVGEIDPKLVLPSDSSNRPDAHHIVAEEWDEAETTKHIQEDLQRADAKARILAQAAR